MKTMIKTKQLGRLFSCSYSHWHPKNIKYCIYSYHETVNSSLRNFSDARELTDDASRLEKTNASFEALFQKVINNSEESNSRHSFPTTANSDNISLKKSELAEFNTIVLNDTNALSDGDLYVDNECEARNSPPEEKSVIKKVPDDRTRQKIESAKASMLLRVIYQHNCFQNIWNNIIKEIQILKKKRKIQKGKRYTQRVISLTVRPILQLMDYPFTPYQIAKVTEGRLQASSLLKSLKKDEDQKYLEILYSEQGILLDWSLKTFLLRRYPSIHRSWEFASIIASRFNWMQDQVTISDFIRYFTPFLEKYIEISACAFFESTPVNRLSPCAIPLDQLSPEQYSTLTYDNVIIRRRFSETNTQLSLTESIRLFGKSVKFRSRNRRDYRTEDSLSSIVDTIEKEISTSSGDIQENLTKALEVISPLSQAQFTKGNSIQEFSLGNISLAVNHCPLRCSNFGSKNQEIHLIKNSPAFQNSTKCEPTHPPCPVAVSSCDKISSKSFSASKYETVSMQLHQNNVKISSLTRKLMNNRSPDVEVELRKELDTVREVQSNLTKEFEKLTRFKLLEDGLDFTSNNYSRCYGNRDKVKGDALRAESSESTTRTGSLSSNELNQVDHLDISKERITPIAVANSTENLEINRTEKRLGKKSTTDNLSTQKGLDDTNLSHDSLARIIISENGNREEHRKSHQPLCSPSERNNSFPSSKSQSFEKRQNSEEHYVDDEFSIDSPLVSPPSQSLSNRIPKTTSQVNKTKTTSAIPKPFSNCTNYQKHHSRFKSSKRTSK